MDGFVLGGVVLVLTVVVYILATLGTKETTYEEALIEQKKSIQESAPPKQDKQTKFKPPKIKKPKTKKESEPEAPAKPAAPPVVVAEPEPVPKREPTPTPAPSPPVAEPQPSPQPQQDKKKDKKKKKDKEEKKSKDTDAEASSGTSRKEKVVEKVEETVVTKVEAPKTEASKPEASKQESAPKPSPPPQAKEQKKEVEAPVKRHQIEIIETVENQIVPNASTAAGKVTPTQDKRDKKKKDKASASIVQQTEMKVLSLVEKSMLSGNEIQQLINILLNKQQQNNEGGEWVEKGRVDPITQLRKQLEDVETRLKDKDEAHVALTAKITDLRAELNGERSRSVKLKTQLDDTIANHTRQQEVAATNAVAAQTAKLNDLRKELEQEYKTQIEQQRPSIEQEGEVTALRASLSDAEVQTAVLHKQKEEMTRAYDEHIRKLEEKLSAEEVNKNAQLAELHTQLASSDAARAQALSEATSLAAERDSLKQQLTNNDAKFAQAQHKLQESLREKSEVDSRHSQVESELNSVQQVVLEQANQIERLKEEKESLASQSVRPAAEGQENGDVHAEQSVTPDTTHLESLVKEKDSLIEQHVSEVKNLNKEITRLKEDLETQRAKNNELRGKNHTVLEALSSTEEKLVARLKQVNEASSVVETEKSKVRAVLRRIFPDVAVDDALEQDAFLKEFESKASQVSMQAPAPVPEVVEKVVEKEIMVEDPALKSKVEELTRENSELKTQVAEIQNSIPKVDDSKRVTELEEEVKTVTEKVAHYQTVLADTEALLKTLQASVESEEVNWNKKLSERESNVKQLTADKANLELKVKQLEGTLDKVRQADELDAQLKVLQEQLQREEKEKTELQEQLQDAQEQLTKTATQGGSEEENVKELRVENDKLRTLVTVGQDASRGQDQLIQQLQQELAAVKAALAASRVSKMGYMVGWVGRNSDTTGSNRTLEQQSASTNGPANEEQCQEDDHSRADTESLMSASSASVTDTNSSQVESKGTAKKKKSKRKGAGAK